MKIENSIFIAAPPEIIYTFFEDIEAIYLNWHPDHRKFNWIKGNGIAEGNVFYFEEEIDGELEKKEAVHTKVIPSKYIEFKMTNWFYRFLLPKMTFIFDSQDDGCIFTQQVFVRIGPIGRCLNRKKFAAVYFHQQEECKNLKKIIEGKFQ
jgi:hypothetical protein